MKKTVTGGAITLTRKTHETSIELSLTLFGEGECLSETGVGFLDHMMHALARHALMDLSLTCRGDLHVDAHHTVEDCAIVLGCALKEALYPLGAVERFGEAVAVMDEAAVQCVLDLSNRPFLFFDLPLSGEVGTLPCELVEEWFRAFAMNASLTLHLTRLRGHNQHHLIEASFKALALSLRRALHPRRSGVVPSTKGVV